MLFTRNLINGHDELLGEYREMTQQDVVMGNIITRSIAAIPPRLKEEFIRYKTPSKTS
ncbi:hypothetical protein MASR1M12_37450 [Erysipelotrichia bacterium]